MALKKIIIILILICVSVAFCADPIFANQVTADESTSGVESFLEIMTSWGTHLAHLTGSYAILENLFDFSKLIRWFDNFIEGGDLTPMGFIKYLLEKMNIDIYTAPNLPKKNRFPEESYSL